jgi:hypothetical protein
MNRQLDSQGYLHIRDINDWGINFNKIKRENVVVNPTAQDLINEVCSNDNPN